MAEILAAFSAVLVEFRGIRCSARACGRHRPAGLWEGWIEFVPVDGTGPALRSPTETTQPSRAAAVYWATGLTLTFLEGSLQRALQWRRTIRFEALPLQPAFEAPLPHASGSRLAPRPRSPLDPFALYQKGEVRFRRQLSALALWQLVKIAQLHRLSDLEGHQPRSKREAIEAIVSGVRRFMDQRSRIRF